MCVCRLCTRHSPPCCVEPQPICIHWFRLTQTTNTVTFLLPPCLRRPNTRCIAHAQSERTRLPGLAAQGHDIRHAGDTTRPAGHGDV
eukprot:1241957-Prymnesium_polylepis.1